MLDIKNVKKTFIDIFILKIDEYLKIDEDVIREQIVMKTLFKITHILHLNGYTYISCSINNIKFAVYDTDKYHIIYIDIKQTIRSLKLKKIL